MTSLRGALGFLTRLPVGHDERAWRAFRRTPAAFPLAGYPVGALLALALLVPDPAPTVAAAFVLGVYFVTGINHAVGLADRGDAAVVHGSLEKRREVMHDTATGVGGVLALALGVVALAFAGRALAALPLAAAAGIVVAAEVGAKFGMALLVCLSEPAHEGLGSAFAGEHRPRALAGPLAATLPAVALSPAAFAAVCGATLAAVAVGGWARTRLGGVSGDVLGATNECGRVLALHAGVIAWTLS